MASLVQYLGLARSLALYYADPDQVHRAARFYRRVFPGAVQLHDLRAMNQAGA